MTLSALLFAAAATIIILTVCFAVLVAIAILWYWLKDNYGETAGAALFLVVIVSILIASAFVARSVEEYQQRNAAITATAERR